MEKNYTPIDIGKFGKGNGSVNNVLFFIAVITAVVLAVMLFLLIQKKLKQSNLPSSSAIEQSVKVSPTLKVTTAPEIIVSPTIIASPSVTLDKPTRATIEADIDQKTATISPTIMNSILPTSTATKSSDVP